MKHYEVVTINGEFCLRLRVSKRPVAWAKTNSAEFRAYCAEMEQHALDYLED